MRSSILCLVVATISCVVSATSFDSQIVLANNGISGLANTTRYWDCCKPACSWRSNTNKLVTPCEIDGVTEIKDYSIQSGCLGGTAFACTKQHSYAVNNSFALGFASAFFGGLSRDMCCTCFHLKFQGSLAGRKEMIVQVINSGDDYPKASVTFDLAVPGGGVGAYNMGCPKQWNSPADGWGERYGGVKTRADCAQLPTQLRDFCTFRFDFLEGISNPPATYEEVSCPAVLSAATGCVTS